MLTEYEQIANAKVTLDQRTYLGPARVREIDGRQVQLEFPDELPWAVLALAYPYQPVVGDTIMAVGQGRDWYVIGVLEGTGKITLLLPGDFTVLAPKGRINLIAGKGLHLKSPDVKITAGKLELVAKRILQTFSDAICRVKNTWQVYAERLCARADADYQVKAARIIQQAQHDVRIDGEKIHLG